MSIDLRRPVVEDAPYDYYDLYTENLKKRDIHKIKKTALFIARKGCPKDTFNMALNAIYAINTRGGFAIVWDERFAYYLPYVDKGINPLVPNSSKVKANKGFVKRSIALVWSYFYFNPRNKSRIDTNKALREEKGNLFSSVENLYKSYISKTKEAPMFVKMVHDIQSGKSPCEVTEGSKRLISNLFKSVKQAQAQTTIGGDNFLNVDDLIFDFDKQKVFQKYNELIGEGE